MEAKQSPKHQPVVFQYLGVATVFSITYLCIASLDFVFAQILATYAAEIMLLWLALGFVALWRNNPLWLGTFFYV